MQLHGGKNPIVLYQEMKLQFELHVSIEQLPCNVTGPFADPFVDHLTIFVSKKYGSSVIFCHSCLCFLGLATCGCRFITRFHVYRSRGCYAAETTGRWQCHTEPKCPQPSVRRWIQSVVKRGNPCLGRPGLRSLQG